MTAICWMVKEVGESAASARDMPMKTSSVRAASTHTCIIEYISILLVNIYHIHAILSFDADLYNHQINEYHHRLMFTVIYPPFCDPLITVSYTMLQLARDDNTDAMCAMEASPRSARVSTPRASRPSSAPS
jgi:hypothetical protein